MPIEVIVQVHYLAKQAKAKKILTCANPHDEDLDVLNKALGRDEDDANPDHNHNELAVVDGEDEEDTSNNDYGPEQDGDKDSDY